MTVRKGVAVAGLVLLSLSGCSPTDPGNLDDVTEAMQANRGKWRSQGIDSYEFVLRRLCFCAGGTDPARLLVRSGTRLSVTDVTTGQPIPAEWAQYYPTVDGLFEFIADAIAQKAHSIEVEYHAVLGYPTSIRIDYIENAIDEEMAFEASALLPHR